MLGAGVATGSRTGDQSSSGIGETGVQLMGGLPLLGAQVAGVVPLGVGYALLESEVAPLLGHKAHLPLCC